MTHREINGVARHSLNIQRFFVLLASRSSGVESDNFPAGHNLRDISRACSVTTPSLFNSTSGRIREKERRGGRDDRDSTLSNSSLAGKKGGRSSSPLQQTLNNFNESPSRLVRFDFTTLIGTRIFAWLLVLPLETYPIFFCFLIITEHSISSRRKAVTTRSIY